MSNLVEVGKTTELAEGTMKKVSAQGRDILLARVGGKYYAGNNKCPHMGGNLSRGKLEGTVVTCPVHGSQFDLTDGRVVRWVGGSGLLGPLLRLKPRRPLGMYKVTIQDEKILIEI
jgi:3-phenylpropionate/trans-cinnamate dioxygenase ferredoxin subunit